MVATAFGDTVSVVSGGLACIAGAFLVAWALPGFTRLRSGLDEKADDATWPTAGRRRRSDQGEVHEDPARGLRWRRY